MRIAIAAFTAALLATTASPALADDHAAPLAAEIPSDLPRNARPSHYRIHVVPDMPNLRFTGSTSIDIDVFEPSDAITLHAAALDIKFAQLVPLAGGAPVALTVSLDEGKQTASLAAPATIAPGAYRLDMTYWGTINTQATGLFALDYPDKRTGEEVRGLFTQFEAPDGRRFSPMFDEPSYKATFDLTATVPANLMPVSNMPVIEETANPGGTKTVTFDTSPHMSSYLLFFGLGDFERKAKMAAEGTEVAIIAPTGSGDQVNYALDSMAEMMPFFSDYFDMPYGLPKLDNVTGPGRSQFFGAMENWGAIFTFERILLFDPAVSSAQTKNAIYTVTAHEVAHQWFGNIVTMAWWDDLWLNEGFASWMETKTTANFNPDWQAEYTRVASRETAMGLDSLKTTHPIVQEISTVGELGAAFDLIAYQKGEAVISMFEAYAGEETFRDGLRVYMKRHQFANTRNTDLWRAVEEAGASDLTEIAEDFTLQQGVPLVEVTGLSCDGGSTRLSLKQSEYSRDRKEEALANPLSWKVPLLLRVGNTEGTRHVLDGSATYTLQGCGPVVVNGGQLGYFRTLYTPEALEQVTENFSALSGIDQYGLMRDAISLSRSGHQPLSAGLDVLAAIPNDAEGILAESALNRWQEFYELLPEAEREVLAGRVAAGWLPRLQLLGWEQPEDEGYLDSNLRTTLIRALGYMGEPTVLAEANRRFAALEKDPRALDGPLKSTWLQVVAANASAEQWELLRRLARDSGSAVEKQVYYAALASNDDKEIAAKTLAFALTDEPGATNGASIIAGVVGQHPELGWNFFEENRAAIDNLLDASGRPNFYGRLLAGANTEELFARGQAFRDSLPEDQRIAMDRALSAMRDRLDTEPVQRAALIEWLAE